MTRLEQERIDRHMSRADLAEASTVDVKTIRRLEEHGGAAHVKTLAKLSTVLDVPASQLLLVVVTEDAAA